MIQDHIREAAAKKLLFLPHAIRQMNKPDRMITPAEVREVVLQADVIEDYPGDVRGHSCLLMGKTSQDRIVHVVFVKCHCRSVKASERPFEIVHDLSLCLHRVGCRLVVGASRRLLAESRSGKLIVRSR